MTHHDTHHDQDFSAIRESVARLCAQFPGEYWRRLDREMAYPKEFVQALIEAGYLSVLPVVTTLSFQGRQLNLLELWVGLPILAATVLGVIAMVAGLAGARMLTDPEWAFTTNDPPGTALHLFGRIFRRPS